MLKHLRNVRWLFGDIVPDYLLGQSACALYLRWALEAGGQGGLRSLLTLVGVCSLRYHLLHPDYLYFRIRELQKGFRLRVVLCHVDVVSASTPRRHGHIVHSD